MSPRTFIPAFLAFVFLLLGAAAPAHAVDTPFSVRYAQTMRGNIEATGNQLLTCPAAAAGCTNARARTGAVGTMNNNYNMGYVDVDSDAATINSSSATLTLPAGATVAWAGLYWGADTSGQTAALDAPDAANRGTVKFKAGSGAYQTVTAQPADVISSTGKATRYRAFANVSSLVNGNGTYSVADVQTGRGDDKFAGWSLVVAYQAAGQDMHRVSVYDGLGTVDATHTFSTNIAPFYTPATGAVVTKTGLLAFEGDAGLQTEVATFNGTALTDSLNTLNNLENSSMTVDGVYMSGRNPSYNNTQGTDIDVFNNTGLLANHQSSAMLAFSSTQDLFVPSALWLVSDEGPASNTSDPSIGGIARDGSTLTADPGGWDGTPTITYEYQWQRCDASGNNCVNIPGATGSTYTLGPDDVGSTIRVVVTAVNDAGSSNPATSGATGTIGKLAPSNVTVPAVSGLAQDDQTLITTTGSWNGTGPLDYDYQWQRCDASGNNCADIAGATGWSYTLTGADIGSTIRSEVTATNAAGSATAHSVPSGTVDPVAPVNTTAPALSGAATDGHTLSATTGTWTGTDPIDYTYQWQRCDSGGGNCADIAGETGSSYDLAAADIGHAVRVQVTATNVAGHATASSSPTTAVNPDPPANTVAPALSGTAQDGSTLTLDDGTWTGTDPLAFDVVWQRCDSAGANCAAIAGETGTTYTLTSADIDSTIRALVTASNVAGIAAAQTAPTTVVAPEPPANTVAPVVSGTRVDGQTLSTNDGTWSGTQPILFTYQWQRCDGLVCTDISGATDADYTLTADDIGHVVRAVVTGANGAGAASASSAVAVPVAPAPPVSVVAPTATGTPQAGETLTALDGTWNGSQPMTPAHQWQRCDADGTNCVDIAGATDPTYTLTDDDAGHTVRVEVTYTNAAGSDTGHSTPSAVVQGNPPVNTTDPSISGTPRDGQALTLDDGDWSGTPALVPAYQWQRCDASGANCSDIAGQTGLSYTLQGDDVGHTVRAVVTVTNAWGDASEAADPSGVVLAAPPAVTIDPSVTGTAVDGQTVSADPGVWAGTGPVDFTYQWLRCDLDGTNCTDIAGATDEDYTLTSADADHGIRVEVTGTNAVGSATGTSPVAAVNALAPQNTAPPEISGSLVDGHTLTADEGTWSGTTPLHYDYQWLRCDADGSNCVAIPGETGSSYDLTADDIGHEILVSVQASNSAGSAQAASVPAGDAVQADPPHAVAAPDVTGSAQDGGTLTADTGSFTGTDPIAYTYQWQRCDGTNCTDIAGATGDTYTLTSDDIGHGVRVVLTGTNVAGDDTASSTPTAAVTAAPPASTTPPSIAGVTVDGQTLTADHGAFSGTGPLDFTYQWQRCDADGTNCADLPGATDDTYDLVSSDVGGAIRVIVTATNGAGSDSATSSATTEVLALAPANVTPPSISGTPLDGHTLTADPGTWSGTQPIDFGYQWQRCDADGANCTDILGADDPTYTLVPADIDHVITVVVTASNAAGSAQSGSAQTAPAEAAPPANTVAPVVTGTLQDGSTLSATTGDWSGTDPIDYTYQWQRCDADGTHCADISGETGSTHDLTGADVGHAIVVEVTAHNAAGDDVATSAPGTSVAVDPPATSGTPAADGAPLDGQTLTADPGAWTGTGPIDFTYQWQRCDAAGANCVDIDDATDETYTLGSGDVGSTVRVVVTGDNGEQTSVASDPVGPIAAAPPVSVTVPTISGTAGSGSTLTAGDGTWGGTQPLDFTYQWQRCDELGANCADIGGATGSSYDLTDTDVGHAIRVEVTATNAAGDETAVSAPTAATLPAPPVNTTPPPAPGGTGIDGGTLTADPGTWSGDLPIDITYQWQRCDADGSHCTDIPGATDDSYSPGPADVGHAIVVVVTATNPGGSTTQTSEPSLPVTAAPPASATPPSVSGDPADGATLTVDPGTWTGTPPDLTYQWQRCAENGTACVDIAGATDGTYTLGSDDVDHAVTVVVTATNPAGTATSTAPATQPVAATPPHDTVAPVIGGTVAPGATLTAGDGTWSGTTPVDFTYQWQRCDADGTNCVDIGGATDDTYTLGDDDLGHTVVVVVTATNAAGTDTSTSAPSAVLPAPPANTTPPSISGTDELGSVLTADPGTWSGTGPFDYTYQWQRCDFFGNDCVDVVGATDDTYTLGDDDLGHTIKVIVTASNAAGSDSATAPASPAVTNPTPTPTPTPTPSPTPSPSPTPTPTPPPGKPKPATPLPTGNQSPAGPVSSSAAFGGLGGSADLGSVPGSLVNDASCQQLLGNSKYSRAEVKGVGTVRLRAYAKGPTTKNSPVRVTTTITRGKAKRVAYKLDGHKLKSKRNGRWKAVITPKMLKRIGVHKLVATVKGKKKKAKKVLTLKLKTTTCRTLFTAQRWRTFSGAGLRLRVDTRSAMQGVSFKVPGVLLPRQMKRKRVIGFVRVRVAGERRPRRYLLKLAKKGKKTVLLRGAGKPTVKLGKGTVTVTSLPARAAVAELTLYRLKKLDGAPKRRAFKLRARVAPTGTTLSVRTKRLR